MSDDPALDTRRTAELQAELVRRTVALLSGDGRALPVGEVTGALLGAAARIGEEVTRRLDRVPDKQLANLLNAAGIGRDPARPATVRVAFTLADGPGLPAGTAPPVARSGTRLMASAPGEPVILETMDDVSLLGGGILAVRGVDAASDAVIVPPDILDHGTRLPQALARHLKSGANAGDSQIQVSPVAGLAQGMVLTLGAAPDAPQHRVVSIEGDLVTIDPPLAATIESGAPASTLDTFAPFAPGARNGQAHRLYLGDETLFDLPSALKLTIIGLPDLPAATYWEWWGTPNDNVPAGWQAFHADVAASGMTLTKPKGKTIRTQVQGLSKFWIRATLAPPSLGLLRGQSIRVAVATMAVCLRPHEERCKGGSDDEPPMDVGFEAVANSTPVVANTPFYPLGTEPRLFDSFYIGCAEAFSKASAEISLCFEFGGPKLGAMVGVSAPGVTEVFGVGTDGLVYRARPTADKGDLGRLPPPSGVDALQPQADIAALVHDQRLLLAVPATKGAVYRAELQTGTELTPANVTWKPLSGPEVDATFTQVAFVVEGGVPATLARSGPHLLKWVGDGPTSKQELENVDDLLVFDGGNRLVAIMHDGTVQHRTQAGGAWKTVASLPNPEKLPTQDRVAWAATPNELVITGRAGPLGKPDEIRVAWIDLSPTAPKPSVTASYSDPVGSLPIGLEPPPQGASVKVLPELVFASNPPQRIVWEAGSPIRGKLVTEPLDIGASDNPRRRFLGFGGVLVVQAPEFGVLYRSGGETSVAVLRLDSISPGYITRTAIPSGTELALFGRSPRFNAFQAVQNTGKWLLLPTGPKLTPPPHGATALLQIRTQYKGTIQINVVHGQPDTATLIGPSALTDKKILIEVRDTAPIGYFQLTRPDATSNWPLPRGFPSGPSLAFTRLEQVQGGAEKLDLDEAARIRDPKQLTDALDKNTVWYVGTGGEPKAVEADKFGSDTAITVPHNRIGSGGKLELMVTPSAMEKITPNAPTNPTLSWEYWNGMAWWALRDRGLADHTANLLVNDGVFFRVPSDLRPSDVGGKQNYWVRARLVGGDYGQARVMVKRTPGPAGSNTETQEIERDVTAVRAPYVVRLRVGYCMPELVTPDTVVTEDNLGTRNQTSANKAGQPVEFFAPAAVLLDPVPAPPAAADDGRCDDPCPPPTPEPPPQGCGCGGAGPSSGGGAADAGSQGVTRGILVGLARPPVGDRLTLFADVVPGGSAGRLQVDVLRAGRFQPLAVDDGTRGLTEPGILAFPLRQSTELVELMGVTGCWLRLSKLDEPTWSPRLKALYLNAAAARSVETRALAGLGASSGAPGQQFRLAQPPVEPGSVELFVRQTLTEDEVRAAPAGAVVDAIGDMPGPFVRWYAVDDLSAYDPARRVFDLDADSGVVTFGNAQAGAIPPLGADIVVRSYRRVIGEAANAVFQDAELQLVSPIAGVESVKALEPAAGGADAEPPDQARARGPAKLRHGGRLQTLADLEEAVMASGRDVAQVKAATWRGGVRLIVALGSDSPVPGPARLRAVHAALAEAAGYGITRPNGLTVVGPRPLTLLLRIAVRLDSLDNIVAVQEGADAALRALFDPRSGGADGKGWPFGRRPVTEDCMGALDSVGGRAVIDGIEILDAGSGAPLPDAIAADRLVRVAEVRVDPTLVQGAAG